MTDNSASLIIGVTGHRKLADESRLAAAVDAALDEVVRRATEEGSGAPPQLIVLSPLAEGADRLVAKRVLARAGAVLEVVLPLPEDEYAVDFKTAGSRVEFAGLLARARTIHRLSRSPSREESYAAAGRYVVDHCDVLFAIWNGKPEGGGGGTAGVVRYAREARRALAWIRPDEPGPVRIDRDFGSRI
jgi:hypothetical protein